MAHEIERMMYVGKTPWHNLGVKLATAPTTVEEALKVAGLDWTVALDQLVTSDGRKVDRFAVVRSTDNAILGTVGPDYTPAQNLRAFAPLQALLIAGLATIETGGSLRGGARVWMLLRLNRPNAVIGADDEISKYVLCAQGHDGSLGWYFGETLIRVVCANTLSGSIAADGFRMLRLRHTASINDAIDAATRLIDGLDAHFERAAEVFRYMAKIRITEAQLKAYVDAVFPAPKAKIIAPPSMVADAAQIDGAAELGALLTRPSLARESTFSADVGAMTDDTNRRVYAEIRDLFEGKAAGSDLETTRGTAYGAYNAVTDYLSHSRGRSDDNRANNLAFGDIGTRAATAARQILMA